MYEQGYADFWNFCDPQEDNSEYNIGWADALAEYDNEEYLDGKADAFQGNPADRDRGQAYMDGYNEG